MAQQCQLWMGSLQPYMNEDFIVGAFRTMGEDPASVKLMKNKYTGVAAGYCFVSFVTDDVALNAMHKLNGKPIPGTNPIVRFKLNPASSSQSKMYLSDCEYSVWVGDISPDVDDYNLYRVFAAKYQSIKSAKIIMDNSGFSRGYGFVKFGLEGEQKSALYEMNGFLGLGSKPLKVCCAALRTRDGPVIPQQPMTIGQNAYDQYSQYYQQYAMGQYYWPYQQGYGNYSGYDQGMYYAQQSPVTFNPIYVPQPIQYGSNNHQYGSSTHDKTNRQRDEKK